MKTTVLQSGLKKISCNKKQLLKCYNIDAQNGEKKLKNFWKHLTLTFLIMGICWGLCLVLSLNGITMKDYKWIYLPWMLGGISPAIASFPLYFLPLMILAMIFGGGLEEAGWRYITWPELDKKFGFVLSTLITAAVLIVISLLLIFIIKKGKNFTNQ